MNERKISTLDELLKDFFSICTRTSIFLRCFADYPNTLRIEKFIFHGLASISKASFITGYT